MAIALRQSKSVIDTGLPKLTFSSAVAAGSLIVVYCALYTGNFTVTGSLNGAYTEAITKRDSGFTNSASIWYKANSAAGTEIVTCSTDGGYLSAIAMEFTGAATTSPLEYTGFSTGKTVTASAANAATGNVQVSGATANFGSSNINFLVGGVAPLFLSNASDAYTGCYADYAVESTVGPATLTFTSDVGGSDTFNHVIATFKAAAGGPTIVSADAGISNSDTTAAVGAIIANSVGALSNSDTTLLVAGKIINAVGDLSNVDTESYAGSAITSAVGALSNSDTTLLIGGSFAGSVMGSTNDGVAMFDSNAIASGQADLVSSNDAVLGFVATGLAGAQGDVSQYDLTTLVSGAIIAAAYAATNDGTFDGQVTIIRTAVAALVADAIVYFQSGALPGDGGATTPAAANRRMTRLAPSRVMQRTSASRTMERTSPTRSMN